MLRPQNFVCSQMICEHIFSFVSPLFFQLLLFLFFLGILLEYPRGLNRWLDFLGRFEHFGHFQLLCWWSNWRVLGSFTLLASFLYFPENWGKAICYNFYKSYPWNCRWGLRLDAFSRYKPCYRIFWVLQTGPYHFSLWSCVPLSPGADTAAGWWLPDDCRGYFYPWIPWWWSNHRQSHWWWDHRSRPGSFFSACKSVYYFYTLAPSRLFCRSNFSCTWWFFWWWRRSLPGSALRLEKPGSSCREYLTSYFYHLKRQEQLRAECLILSAFRC